MQSWDTRKSFRRKSSSFQSKQSLSISLSTTALFTFTLARRTKPRGELQQPYQETTCCEVNFLRWYGKHLQRLDFCKAMSIFVCSGAGIDFLWTNVSKTFRQDIAFVSTCVETKNPSFGTWIQLFQRLRNLTRMVGRGLNIHLIFFCNRALWILLWFHEPMDSLSSLSPPVKLVPLSDLISLTWPLLPINCLDAIKKGSVPKLCAIFMFFARIAKHVEIPTDVKDGRSGVRRLTGKSTIFCSQTGRWRWRWRP